VSGLASIGITAPTSDQFSVKRPDRHSVATTLFNNIGNIVVKEDVSRPYQVIPLRDEISVNIEYLDSVVFSVANVDAIVLVDANLVQYRKLTWTCSCLAPRVFQLTVSAESVDTTVAYPSETNSFPSDDLASPVGMLNGGPCSFVVVTVMLAYPWTPSSMSTSPFSLCLVTW